MAGMTRRGWFGWVPSVPAGVVGAVVGQKAAASGVVQRPANLEAITIRVPELPYNVKEFVSYITYRVTNDPLVIERIDNIENLGIRIPQLRLESVMGGGRLLSERWGMVIGKTAAEIVDKANRLLASAHFRDGLWILEPK